MKLIHAKKTRPSEASAENQLSVFVGTWNMGKYSEDIGKELCIIDTLHSLWTSKRLFSFWSISLCFKTYSSDMRMRQEEELPYIQLESYDLSPSLKTSRGKRQHSLRKTRGKSVTGSGYAFITK